MSPEKNQVFTAIEPVVYIWWTAATRFGRCKVR